MDGDVESRGGVGDWDGGGHGWAGWWADMASSRRSRFITDHFRSILALELSEPGISWYGRECSATVPIRAESSVSVMSDDAYIFASLVNYISVSIVNPKGTPQLKHPQSS